jgi:hypothetical protein
VRHDTWLACNNAAYTKEKRRRLSCANPLWSLVCVRARACGGAVWCRVVSRGVWLRARTRVSACVRARARASVCACVELSVRFRKGPTDTRAGDSTPDGCETRSEKRRSMSARSVAMLSATVSNGAASNASSGATACITTYHGSSNNSIRRPQSFAICSNPALGFGHGGFVTAIGCVCVCVYTWRKSSLPRRHSLFVRGW